MSPISLSTTDLGKLVGTGDFSIEKAMVREAPRLSDLDERGWQCGDICRSFYVDLGMAAKNYFPLPARLIARLAFGHTSLGMPLEADFRWAHAASLITAERAEKVLAPCNSDEEDRLLPAAQRPESRLQTSAAPVRGQGECTTRDKKQHGPWKGAMKWAIDMGHRAALDASRWAPEMGPRCAATSAFRPDQYKRRLHPVAWLGGESKSNAAFLERQKRNQTRARPSSAAARQRWSARRLRAASAGE